MEVTTSSFFSLSAFAPVFLFFFSLFLNHGNSQAIYLFLASSSSSSLFLSFSPAIVCNLDKYPLCQWCKCTRRDRKKNDSSRRRRVAARKISQNYSWIANPGFFSMSRLFAVENERSRWLTFISCYFIKGSRTRRLPSAGEESSFILIILESDWDRNVKYKLALSPSLTFNDIREKSFLKAASCPEIILNWSYLHEKFHRNLILFYLQQISIYLWYILKR